jgi:hypothetical protein
VADDVQAFAASFVVLEPSEITLTDPDQDGDLDKYTDITVVYTPPGGSPIQWPVINITPIITTVKNPDGTTTQVVNSVVIQVIPEVPPPGCLGLFIPSFPRFKKKRVVPEDPPTSGPVTGTLNPPPGSAGNVAGRTLKTKSFSLNAPLIFYGILA